MKGYAVFALLVMAFAIAVSTGAGHLIHPSQAPRVVAAPAPAQPEAAPTSAPDPVPDPVPIIAGNFETILPRRANGHFYARASVDGQPVDFIVDTGATTVALSIDDARRLGIAFDPAGFQVIGTGASGPVKGVRVSLADVELEGKHAANVDAVILAGLETSLLGQSYLRTLGSVEISGNEMKLR